MGTTLLFAEAESRKDLKRDSGGYESAHCVGILSANFGHCIPSSPVLPPLHLKTFICLAIGKVVELTIKHMYPEAIASAAPR